MNIVATMLPDFEEIVSNFIKIGKLNILDQLAKRFEEIDCTVTNERNENKTGDIFSPALLYSLIGVAVVSVLVIAFILIKRKSNKSEE